ncbi:MAG: ABC transporter permease subunit [Planctomycetes bacterium]|nr:ABC transporter permease subunit [Planctomycetota bacterium]
MRQFRCFSFAVLAAYAALVLAPVAAFGVAALRGGLATEAWGELWRQAARTRLLWNSLALSTLTAFGTLLVGVPLGFLLARTDVAWRQPLTLLCAAPLALPPFLWATALALLGLLMAWVCQRGHAPGGAAWLASQLPLFALPSAVVGLGLVSLWNRPAFSWFYGTMAMIVLGHVARFAPLAVRALAAALAQVPKDCEEAIWLDGGGVATTLRHFVAPAAGRALALLWAGSFVLCMGELAVAILVAPPGVQTLAVRLFTIEANAPEAHTASLALVMVAACVLPLALWGVLLRKEAAR